MVFDSSPKNTYRPEDDQPERDRAGSKGADHLYNGEGGITAERQRSNKLVPGNSGGGAGERFAEKQNAFDPKESGAHVSDRQAGKTPPDRLVTASDLALLTMIGLQPGQDPGHALSADDRSFLGHIAERAGCRITLDRRMGKEEAKAESLNTQAQLQARGVNVYSEVQLAPSNGWFTGGVDKENSQVKAVMFVPQGSNQGLRLSMEQDRIVGVDAVTVGGGPHYPDFVKPVAISVLQQYGINQVQAIGGADIVQVKDAISRKLGGPGWAQQPTGLASEPVQAPRAGADNSPAAQPKIDQTPAVPLPAEHAEKILGAFKSSKESLEKTGEMLNKGIERMTAQIRAENKNASHNQLVELFKNPNSIIASMGAQYQPLDALEKTILGANPSQVSSQRVSDCIKAYQDCAKFMRATAGKLPADKNNPDALTKSLDMADKSIAEFSRRYTAATKPEQKSAPALAAESRTTDTASKSAQTDNQPTKPGNGAEKAPSASQGLSGIFSSLRQFISDRQAGQAKPDSAKPDLTKQASEPAAKQSPLELAEKFSKNLREYQKVWTKDLPAEQKERLGEALDTVMSGNIRELSKYLHDGEKPLSSDARAAFTEILYRQGISTGESGSSDSEANNSLMSLHLGDSPDHIVVSAYLDKQTNQRSYDVKVETRDPILGDFEGPLAKDRAEIDKWAVDLQHHMLQKNDVANSLKDCAMELTDGWGAFANVFNDDSGNGIMSGHQTMAQDQYDQIKDDLNKFDPIPKNATPAEVLSKAQERIKFFEQSSQQLKEAQAFVEREMKPGGKLDGLISPTVFEQFTHTVDVNNKTVEKANRVLTESQKIETKPELARKAAERTEESKPADLSPAIKTASGATVHIGKDGKVDQIDHGDGKVYKANYKEEGGKRVADSYTGLPEGVKDVQFYANGNITYVGKDNKPGEMTIVRGDGTTLKGLSDKHVPSERSEFTEFKFDQQGRMTHIIPSSKAFWEEGVRSREFVWKGDSNELASVAAIAAAARYRDQNGKEQFIIYDRQLQSKSQATCRDNFGNQYQVPAGEHSLDKNGVYTPRFSSAGTKHGLRHNDCPTP